ncbi:SDR family oxidoreductase [Mangrovicoccus ximenensis]|uniref:SDR family oxidoreductase n=1 Tax=Mangrovicoccus ximenensis TaxID=1911570 RepID=UPI000D368AC9|nr:SDR family oxidoreductase [Mangrovicoccus ximenensis]
MFRKFLFWAHFATGAVAGVLIFLMSATGLLLAYQPQITEVMVRAAVDAPAGQDPLDPDALLAAAVDAGAMPGQTLMLHADPAVPPDITVNIVAPGATDTPMLRDPARAAERPKMPPVGRMVRPEEVAGTVAFLLGPDAGAITGQSLVICGGGSL